MKLISFSNKNPATVCLIFAAMPTLDAAALCAVPNASLTKTSPKEAQYLPSSGLFLLSLFPSISSNLVFSNMSTSPSLSALIASSKTFPLVTGTNTTFCFKCSLSLFATISRLFLALSVSSLTRPRCENTIAFPPWESTYLIVGNASTILFSSLISPFFNGTLKSTRINTFLPLTLMSLIVFFAIIFPP